MRVKAKVLILSLVSLMTVSTAVVTGLVFLNIQPASSSSSIELAMDPAVISDETKQSGSLVSFNVDITNATDLFAWQVNISWNPAILNYSKVTEYGSFLRATTSPNGTSGWINRDPLANVTIAPFNNTLGYAAIAETILGDYSGITGDGRLVTVEFEVVGYGETNLTISVSGTLATTLLDSAGGSVTFDTADGYFRNTLPGDIQGDTGGTPPDGDVDRYDFFAFLDHYGSSVGDPNYNRLADLEDDVGGPLPDGDVDRYDFFAFLDNYGRP